MLALTSPASASRFTAWYFGVDGGASWVEDLDVLAYATPGPVPLTASSADFGLGWAAFASTGYAFANSGWRAEIEGGYRHNDIDTLTPPALPAVQVDGDLNEYTLMANVLYDFPSAGGVMLTLGAGVGADYARTQTAALGPLPAFDGDDISLAFQGIAGLSYPVTSWMDLTLNYRYLLVTDLNFDDQDTIAPAVAHVDTVGNLHKHTVTMGLRFGGRGPDRPMVAAAKAPPPPPPPPQAARQYVIYFAFNKCSITAEADGVLSEAAAATKQLGAVAVKIVGHTDTVGSASTNQRLSECRADAAKSNMVQKGVPAGSIQTVGRGETQLLVQTGNNVKEPQNRRATVDLN